MHKEEYSKGVFYYEVNNDRRAAMTCSREGNDKFIIDHTEVDESLKGQGIGYALVEKAVEIIIKRFCHFAHLLRQYSKRGMTLIKMY